MRQGRRKVYKTIWLSLSSDKVYNTESEAWASGDDFVEGFYCTKCKCTSTSECGCVK
jgi:hypothetical protein